MAVGGPGWGVDGAGWGILFMVVGGAHCGILVGGAETSK